MTLPALLHHHGIHIPRFVTIAGTVVFEATRGSAVATSSTSAHATPVLPHRFHGGDEDEDRGNDGAPGWWTEETTLQRYRDAMALSFPGFVEVTDDDGPPAWAGVLDTGRGRFEILVIGRWDGGLPRVVPFRPKRFGKQRGRYWVPSPHLYVNGNLCVAAEDDWERETHTVATVVCWAAHWLAAYTEWRITDRWPVEGYIQDVPA